MRVHYLQHVPFEGLGSMEPVFRARGHALSASHLYRGDGLPDLGGVDWLVVMGGPMGVADEDIHPWIGLEKTYLVEAIERGCRVLGVCLGAQLIASALGSAVSRNPVREIGWHPVRCSEELASTPLGGVLPSEFMAFHWHGDTFDIPAGAVSLGASDACPRQGFVLEDRVVGLQFHLETQPAGARLLLEQCAGDLDGSPFVQPAADMLDTPPALYAQSNRLMADVLTVLGA